MSDMTPIELAHELRVSTYDILGYKVIMNRQGNWWMHGRWPLQKIGRWLDCPGRRLDGLRTYWLDEYGAEKGLTVKELAELNGCGETRIYAIRRTIREETGIIFHRGRMPQKMVEHFCVEHPDHQERLAFSRV